MSNETVRDAIEDIALRPGEVGLMHAKILRDEIVELRSTVARMVREARVTENWNDHPATLVLRRDLAKVEEERDEARKQAREYRASAVRARELVDDGEGKAHHFLWAMNQRAAVIRERDDARAAYDRVTACLEGGVGNPLAQTEQLLAEARTALADERARLVRSVAIRDAHVDNALAAGRAQREAEGERDAALRSLRQMEEHETAAEMQVSMIHDLLWTGDRRGLDVVELVKRMKTERAEAIEAFDLIADRDACAKERDAARAAYDTESDAHKLTADELRHVSERLALWQETAADFEKQRDEARKLLATIDKAHSGNKPSISAMALELDAVKRECEFQLARAREDKPLPQTQAEMRLARDRAEAQLSELLAACRELLRGENFSEFEAALAAAPAAVVGRVRARYLREAVRIVEAYRSEKPKAPEQDVSLHVSQRGPAEFARGCALGERSALYSAICRLEAAADEAEKTT